MKNRPNINLARGFVTPLQLVAPASQRVCHLAPGCRSGFLRTSWIWRAMYPPRSGSRWAQSGYATSLREVAMVQSGCHTSLQWVALHSNRLERMHHVASEPRSKSHFAKMIIFYSLRAQMYPNTSKNSKGCSNT
ncbi:hypothetical protein F2Q70_00024392 [Brassica cretica]|uniref:Uncharacterized protein n=2 Tax=Brassica cretica TaxID=69181 RepID=A0A8S9LAA6_BRACR|nr:hypothetical protein F2Q68_00023754 [Brassica cretica]KAF2603725.1 hypothetical protein F2Q70_00024392 [Brassica cretica]KAF3581833.1 hypothetical protein DY000_02028428 [Brassica cretica]